MKYFRSKILNQRYQPAETAVQAGLFGVQYSG